MTDHKPINLDNTYVTGEPDPPPIERSGGTGVGYGFHTDPEHSIATIRSIDKAANRLINSLDTKLKAEQAQKSKTLAKTTQAQVDSLAASALSPNSSTTERLTRQITVISQLISRHTVELQTLNTQVKKYFKSDPLTMKKSYIVGAYGTRLTRTFRNVVLNDAAFTAAYQAAYQAQSVSHKITWLQDRKRTTELAHAKAEAARIAAEKAKAEAARIAQEALVNAQAIQAANTFRASGAVAVNAPLLVTAAGVVTSTLSTLSLKAAIDAAIVAMSEFAGAVASGLGVGIAALLYSPRLGNGELPARFAFQVPLSTLPVGPGVDLHSVAKTAGAVDMPFRLTSRTEADANSEIILVKTEGQTTPSKVRVIAATYDAQQKTYSATTADTPPRTLIWTPAVTPDNSSTALPAEQQQPPIYKGASLVLGEGRIDVYPEVSEASFEDYIIVFPVDSGMPPIYVLFRDRRDDPGVMTGHGQPDAQVWLSDANRGQGAAIPSRIADKLRGRRFANWDRARKAIWLAVSEDPILLSQFNRGNQIRLRAGRSPRALRSEQIGGRKVFEIHHLTPIGTGGDVYNNDNLKITTPKLHIQIHRTKGANL
ncbi:S-type pyocin domain-containing protein [Pseudomonas urmiensis]|uniref:S-type pyocin domain-containing protein n=1 Tax=Pseudomonas urmiensis TaxID=2745493 RepID=A0A923JVB1_9PSED|nr:S-type pyocin domain-containing protein [Pseudomonas urmiensis]MBV4535741.1 S-type pyocin domain-containing protein [Pseudomonas urmiensis]